MMEYFGGEILESLEEDRAMDIIFLVYKIKSIGAIVFDIRADGRTDGRTDRQTERQTDRPRCNPLRERG